MQSNERRQSVGKSVAEEEPTWNEGKTMRFIKEIVPIQIAF